VVKADLDQQLAAIESLLVLQERDKFVRVIQNARRMLKRKDRKIGNLGRTCDELLRLLRDAKQIAE
jgi:hypothetical protein